jgi:predicted CXXCH cytochrome family protein
MKKLISLFLITFFSVLTAYGAESSCVQCHLSKDMVTDTTIAAAFLAGDIHRTMGLGCNDCHGGDPTRGFKEGDPTVAMDPAKGYKPQPDKAGVPAFCSRCHSDILYMKKFNPTLPTDQFELYKTSVHGQLLFSKQDTKVAVCSDCHHAHGILPASDTRSSVYHQNVPATCAACHAQPEYMKGYMYKGKPIPTNQYDEYSRSVHGALVLQKDDKSAPACNNCHGNHGATPPSLASVSAACGDCHANNRDFFNASPHKDAFKELGYPECEQCHGNHLILTPTDALIGTKAGAICIQCHDQGTPGYDAAAKIRSSIDSLKITIATAESTLTKAERKGVESGQARFDLNPAKDNLIRVRSVQHTADLKQVEEITMPGIKKAEEVQKTALAALGDLKVRQIGLGISIILVLFVTYALWRKIKQVDSETDFEVKK